MEGVELSHARLMLMSKRKDLKSQGLDNKKRKDGPLDKSEIDLIYKRKRYWFR